jgi:DNA-binding NarL/FixJ family response regulator
MSQPGQIEEIEAQMGAPRVAIRVVIAEDAVLLREGLARLLTDAGFEVVARVGDGPSLIQAIDEHRPDVAVVDVRMPPGYRDEGLRAALEARRRVPTCAVMVLSQYVEERYASELLESARGGIGYLLKDRVADVGDFVAAVRQVAAGGTTLDPEVVGQLIARRRHAARLDMLTDREREVLALMAEGRSNSAIAERLVISDGAVEKHVSNIFAKLSLPPAESDHRRVLAVLAYLRGSD